MATTEFVVPKSMPMIFAIITSPGDFDLALRYYKM
jgi:hypothetical protein